MKLMVIARPGRAAILQGVSMLAARLFRETCCLIMVSAVASACTVDFVPGEIPSVFGTEPPAAVQISPVPARGELSSSVVEAVQPTILMLTSMPGRSEVLLDTPEAAVTILAQGSPLQLEEVDVTPIPVALALEEAGLPGSVFHQITEEILTFIIPEGYSSCTNIAMMFGITLEAFYSANPETHVNGRCLIHTGQVVSIPPIEIRELSEYVNLYSCEPVGKRVCIQADEPVEVMVAHTLYGEGGSTFGPGSSSNILQTALNRIHSLEEARGFRAADLSDDEYARLLIHIFAQPYGDIHPQAAYNAFAFAVDRPAAGTGNGAWEFTLQTAQQVLEAHGDGEWWPDGFAPAAALRDPQNAVTSYCSCPSSHPPFDPALYSQLVAFEEKNRATGRSQWYYRYGQHYCSASCVR